MQISIKPVSPRIIVSLDGSPRNRIIGGTLPVGGGSTDINVLGWCISTTGEDITEAMWDTKETAGTVSNLNKKVYGHTEI